MRNRIDDCCLKCHAAGNDYEACHDYCEKYKAAKAEWDAYKALVKKNRSLRRQIDNYHYAEVMKAKIRKDKKR